MDETLSLLELNALVRRSLQQCLPDEYWVKAELSDVHAHANGHCYLELVQKDPHGNHLVARSRAVVWSNVFCLLKPYFEAETGEPFASGIRVRVKVTVQFHELYGYSLTILDIDPTHTLGDLLQRRRDILRRLEEDGVLTLNKELPTPLLPQRIAIVSSATAAGYGDFCHQLQHNSAGYGFYTELFAATMQGQQIEASVLAALDAIHARSREFDVVVIIRGGGATSDLSGFDTYLLAAACAQFPLPIIVGIGHERDETVLDAVAHIRAKTPTAAAEWLIHRMDEAAARLSALVVRLRQGCLTLLAEEQARLATCRTRLPALAQRRLAEAQLSLLALRKDLRRASSSLLANHLHRLELYKQRIESLSPERIFRMGYSLTLKDGKPLTDAAQLQPGDRLTTRLLRGQVHSVVQPEPADKPRRKK